MTRFQLTSLWRRIKYRPTLQKILSNTGWLFADWTLRMGVGLIVGVWMARYLGPEQFGLLSYAGAFVSMFGAIATLGLNNIVVRDLVKEPGTANITLGTALVMRLIGGLLAFVLAVFAISLVRPDDALAKLMVAVLGFTMLFKSSEVVKYWFESQVASKYTVWVESVAFLVFATVKVVLILNQAPLMDFVWVVFVEAAVVAVALLGIFAWRGGSLNAWRSHYQRARTLLQDSWPLVFSALAVMVYMRIDQIMIGQMLGDEEVGIYSAAVRLSEVWYFIPMAIVASVFPAIIDAKNQSEELYKQRLQKLYDLMVVLALLVAVPVTFMSGWLVVLLFGEVYESAGMILAIHIWAGVFVFLGVASGRWYLIENMQVKSFHRAVSGLVVNIGANYLLIPLYGAAGAAVGFLLSQIVAAYLFDVFDKKTRFAFTQKTASMFPFLLNLRRGLG